MERRKSEFLKSSKNCSKAHEKPSSFFKIMIGDFKNVLFIPPKFAETIGGLVKQTVFLRNSNGHSWRVKLTVINGYLAFEEGWHDFVLDHSITAGELVVFKYRGNSMCKVRIFGTSACERINFNERDKKNCTGHKRKATKFLHEDKKIPKTVKRASNHVFHEKKKVTKTIERASRRIDKSSILPTARERIDFNETNRKSSTGAKRKATEFHLENIHVSKGQKTSDVLENRYKDGNFEGKNKVHVIDLRGRKLPDLSRPHSEEQKCYKGVEDLIALEVVHKFLLTEEGVCHIFDENLKNEIDVGMLPKDMLPSEKENRICLEDKIATSRAPSMRYENAPDIPCKKPIIDLTKGEHGNSRSTFKKISKKPQGKGIPPLCISRVDNARAPPDKSIQKFHEHSHVMIRYSRRSGRVPKEVKEEVVPFLKGSNIQVKLESVNGSNLALPAFANFRFSLSLTAQTSWVVLPVKLPSQFGGKAKHARKVILLRDPSKRLWPILYHEDLKFVGFIGGWEHFARGNKLRKGDLCEFEVAQGWDMMLQVHISRA